MRINWHSGSPKKQPSQGNRGKLAIHIGKRLHELRQRQQVSMRAVGDDVGMSGAMICQIENGQSMPTAYTLWRLAKSFDVPVDWFFEGFE